VFGARAAADAIVHAARRTAHRRREQVEGGRPGIGVRGMSWVAIEADRSDDRRRPRRGERPPGLPAGDSRPFGSRRRCYPPPGGRLRLRMSCVGRTPRTSWMGSPPFVEERLLGMRRVAAPGPSCRFDCDHRPVFPSGGLPGGDRPVGGICRETVFQDGLYSSRAILTTSDANSVRIGRHRSVQVAARCRTRAFRDLLMTNPCLHPHDRVRNRSSSSGNGYSRPDPCRNG